MRFYFFSEIVSFVLSQITVRTGNVRIINRSVNLISQPVEPLVSPVTDDHELHGIAEQFDYCVIPFASVRNIGVAFT